GADGGLDRALDAALAQISDADLGALVTDVGGHDLEALLDALARARANGARPTVILAHTVKGWGTALAADPMNHTALMSTAQIESLRDHLGIAAGAEWARFAEASPESALIDALPPLFSVPAARRPDPEVPE